MISIIGANSFIGRNLALSLSDVPAILCARDFAGFDFSSPHHQTVEMDFSNPSTYIDYVRHSQTLILLINSGAGDTQLYADFLNRLNDTNHEVKHIIYASSGGAIYGEGSGNPAKEKDKTHPKSIYGQTKMRIETMLIEASKNSSWSTTALRIANPIGLYTKKKTLVSEAVKAAKYNTPLQLWGERSYIRDYFSVRDLCTAIQKIIAASPTENKIYNIGGGQGYSINEVLEIISKVADKEILIDKQNTKDSDVRYNVLDCSLIENDLGWKATTDIKDIIQEMWEYA